MVGLNIQQDFSDGLAPFVRKVRTQGGGGGGEGVPETLLTPFRKFPLFTLDLCDTGVT